MFDFQTHKQMIEMGFIVMVGLMAFKEQKYWIKRISSAESDEENELITKLIISNMGFTARMKVRRDWAKECVLNEQISQDLKSSAEFVKDETGTNVWYLEMGLVDKCRDIIEELVGYHLDEDKSTISSEELSKTSYENLIGSLNPLEMSVGFMVGICVKYNVDLECNW